MADNAMEGIRRLAMPLTVLAAFAWAPSAAGASAQFEPARCPFALDPKASYRVDCGTVSVPENRAQSPGGAVRLAIAIVRAAANQPQPDPIVFLDGGPGLRSLDVLDLRMHLNATVQRLHEKRDLIFWDQRGVGYSEPHLCTSYDVESFRNMELGYSVEEERQRNVEALKSCAAELKDSTAEVSLLGTGTSAADLEDIRSALGVTTWNVYGSSYGTRLGLVYLRQASGAVRSAFLDGVYPPDTADTFAQAPRMGRVVDLLGRRCGEDPRCNARFPDIAARTFRVIEAARQSPFSVPIKPLPALPVDHLVVNDRLLALALYQAFYDTKLLPYLPALVEQIEKHNKATFEAMAESLVSGVSYIRQSMYVAVECHDQTSSLSAEDIARDDAADPRLAAAFLEDANAAAYCDTWQPAKASGAEFAPAKSAVPTLLLAGDFDPVTPPQYAEHALESLSAGTLFVLPNAGHGGKTSFPCVLDLVAAFIDQPGASPDGNCVAHLPKVPFATDILVLPGLTRLLVGLQSGSHKMLIAGVAATVLLQLICIGACSVALLRRRRIQPLSPDRSFQQIALAASLLAGAAFLALAVQIEQAVRANPNILLLGLEGPQRVLIALTILGGLLAWWVLALALRRRHSLKRSSLGWLATLAAASFIVTAFMFISPR